MPKGRPGDLGACGPGRNEDQGQPRPKAQVLLSGRGLLLGEFERLEPLLPRGTFEGRNPHLLCGFPGAESQLETINGADMETKESSMPDNQTWPCEHIMSIVEKFNTPFFNQANGGLPAADGKIVPWSELGNASSGCEIHKKLGHEKACWCPEYSQRFRIIDGDSGDPLPNVNYEIVDSYGLTVKGVTDKDGITNFVYSKKESTVEVKIFSTEEEEEESCQ